MFASDRFITKKPDQLNKKFLKVHMEATDYYINTHKKNRVYFQKKLGTNLNVELESMEHIEFIAVPSSEFDDNIIKLVVIPKELGYVNTI